MYNSDDGGNEEKVRARLCSLDEETQKRIAQKYYGGKRPWCVRSGEGNISDVQKRR